MKKYKASTMQEAMSQVRFELGDEAIILNSKAIKTSKLFGLITKKSVEVIAAVDEEPIKPKTKNQVIPFEEPQKKKIKAELNDSRPNTISQSEIHHSLNEMKRMMKQLTNGAKRDPLVPDYFLEIEEKLKYSDLSTSLAEEASEFLYMQWEKQKKLSKPEMLELLKGYFLQQLADIEFNQPISKKKFISLVGPTGVGKTTTLAKLAADAVLKQEKSVGFITTDTYRIAAIEQLKTYANILEAPIEVCYNAEDFQLAKEKLSYLDVIFIDTAGRNFLNEEFVKDLQAVINFEEEMDTFLVLSLTSKLSDMKKITDQFWNIGIQKFLFTKKDETSSSSSMYSLIYQYKKAASYITNGQSVPEDMLNASKEMVVEDLLEELK
uniref:flagellar biosynthesis protein FlhF n=1 Tax=Sutcliffiella halmapala TaxID=79882 RepID=UPI0014738A4B|nr:flagellar biosynthesis protein FlhF [Sutcliffiella halmapala]